MATKLKSLNTATPNQKTGGGDQPASSGMAKQHSASANQSNAPGDSIILEEEIDPNYEPTHDEVIEYAKWLGMDLDVDNALLWIAREGLKAPLPENWKPCKTTDTEEIYYFNFATGASTWDHPCDEYYRTLYEEEKKKKGNKHQTEDKKAQQEKEKKEVRKMLGKDKKKKKEKAKLANPLTTGSKGTALDRKPLPGLSGGGRLGGPAPLGSINKLGAAPALTKKKSSKGSEASDDEDDRHSKKRKPSRKRSSHSSSDSDSDRESRRRSKDRDRRKDRSASRSRSKSKERRRSRSRDRSKDRKKSSSRLASKLSSAINSDAESVEGAEERIKEKKKELDRKLRDAEQEFDEKLRRKRDEYEAEMRSAERSHEDELRDKKEQWRKDEKAEARRIRDEIEEREARRREDLRKDNEDRLKEMNEEFSDRFERENRKAEREFEDQIKAKKRRLEKDQQDDLDKLVQQFKEERETEEEKLKQDFEDWKRDEESRLDRKQDSARRALEKDLQQREDKLKDDHKNTMSRMKDAHTEEVAKLRARQDEEERRLRKQLEEIKSRAREDMERAENEQQDGLRSSGGSTGSGNAEKVRSLQSTVRRLEAELQDSKDNVDRLKRRVDDAEDEVKRNERRASEERDEYDKEMSGLRNSLRKAEEKLNRESSPVKRRDDDDLELEGLRERVNMLEQTISERSKEITQLEKDVASRDKDLASLRDENASMERQVELLSASSKQGAQGKVEQLKTLKKQLADLELLLDETKKSNMSLGQDLKTVESEKVNLERRLESTKWDHERLERRVSAVTQELEDAEGRTKAGAKEIEELFAANRVFQREKDDLETQLRTVTRSLKDQEARSKTMEDRAHDLEKSLQKSMDDHACLDSKNKTATINMEQFERKIETLSRENKDLQALVEATAAGATEGHGASEAMMAPLKARLEALAEENSQLETKLKEEAGSRDIVEREHRKLRLEMETIQLTQKSSTNELADAQRQSASLKVDNAELESKLSSLRAEKEELFTKMKRLERDHDTAGRQARNASDETMQLKTRSNELEAALEQTKQTLVATQSELRSTKDQMKTAERERDDAAGLLKSPGRHGSGAVEDVFDAKRAQARAEEAMKKAQFELETALNRVKMADESSDRLKESFEQQMKAMSRKSVTLTTENARLAADLEALRFRADRVGELESQISALRTERNDAMKEISVLKGKLSSTADSLEKLKISGGGVSDPAIREDFAQKRKDLIEQETRRFEEFKLDLERKMADKRRDATDEDVYGKPVTTKSSKTTPPSKGGQWQDRVQAERTLLSKAKTFFDSQKRDIRRRQKRLEAARGHWEQDMREAAVQRKASGGLSKSKRGMLKEIKRGLQQQADELNAAIRQLQATEKWLHEREKKVAKLESMVNQQGAASPGGDGILDESSLFDDITFAPSPSPAVTGRSGSSPESSDLERLSDELDSDFSNMSMAENATAFDPRRGWTQSGKVKRSRGGKMHGNPQNLHPGGWVPWNWPQRQTFDGVAWGGGGPGYNPYMQQYSAPYSGRSFGRVLTNDRVLHGYHPNQVPRARVIHPSAVNNGGYVDAENMHAHVENEWMGRNRPDVDRMQNPIGTNNPDIQHRLSVFQNQLKRWSGDQKSAYDAVGEHSKWLKQFGSEMSKFSVYDNGNPGRAQKRPFTTTSAVNAAILSPRVKTATRGVADIMATVNNSFANEV
jgi:chromosome segregation ATPase